MCRGRVRPGDTSVRVHFAKAVSCSRFVLLARMVTDRRKWNFMNQVGSTNDDQAANPEEDSEFILGKTPL